MGLVASQARLLMLNDRKSSLEFQMQCITGRMSAAAAQTAGIAQRQAAEYTKLTGNPTDAEKAVVDSNLQQLEADLAKINAWDKQLSLMQKQIETQHSAVEQEMQGVQKIIDANIKNTFNVFNHNG